jgi:hypothetical protein
MKKLAFILVVALSTTLNAQNTFENGVWSGLGGWHLTHKEGDNDSLTFALLPTLFTDPATKYEFEKINPRIVTEVFVTLSRNGTLKELTFTEWIQKEVRVIDTTKWDISFESYNFTNNVGSIRGFLIILENNQTGQYRQINFVYDNQSYDGSVTNLVSIVAS